MHRQTSRLRVLARRALFAALAAAPFLLTADASAQAVGSPYRYVVKQQHVDVFGGYIWPAEGRLGVGPKAGSTFGARWGTTITGPIAFELEATYAGLKRPVVDTAFAADSSHIVKGEADFDVLAVLGNVRFNLTGPRTWHSVQPFVLIGGGVGIDLSRENAADTLVARDVRFGFGTSFAGNLGAGFEYFVTPKVGVHVDGSMLLWKLKAPTAFITKGPGVIPASEWERNFKMTAGLSLHF